MTQIKEEEAPFEISDIEDARIIIMIKGKHYSILSKGDKEEAKLYRVALVQCLLSMEDTIIVTPALEDIPKGKLGGLLNTPKQDLPNI